MNVNADPLNVPTAPDRRSWQESLRCDPPLLNHTGGSILVLEDGLYFLYAQVAFRKDSILRQSKSVLLIRNRTDPADVRTLAEGTFQPTAEGSVWVAKVVQLRQDDTVSIEITGEFLTDITFWGACGLQSC